jgi:2-dehydropantoate 2-reductase
MTEQDGRMKIVIFGVGAMGCLFGAGLSKVADVTLAGRWREQIDMLRRARLRIVHPDHYEEYADLHATDDVDSIGLVDAALILTKSPRTEAVARQAAGLLKPDGVVLTLQNGLGNLEVIARHTGLARAAQGVTTEGATVERPGVLRYAGRGRTILANRQEIGPSVQALAALLDEAGFAVEVAEDVSALVWGKLVANAAINPLTALLEVPNGALLESAWARQLMASAAREVARVAEAKGITLPYDDPAAEAARVAEATAANHSSMLQDVKRGAPTEIEAITGAVIREGRANNVPTPTAALLYGLIKAREETALHRI